MASGDGGSGDRRGSRGPNRLGTVNLRDVAAKAEVSLATASRVFAGGSVGADTKARVEAAADELGYVINGLARAMTGRGPRTLAFVVRAMIGPTFATLAAGVEQVAGENGHILSISTTQGSIDREQDLIGTLREQRAIAVLLVGAGDTDATSDERIVGYGRALAAVDAPLILCGRPGIGSDPRIVGVDYDQDGGVRRAVEHLRSLGHRRIAYVGQSPASTTARARELGFRSAMAGQAAIRHVHADNTEDDGARAAGELLDRLPDTTALVCMTDSIAVGAYRAARRRGLRIPDDLSIVGFDDIPIVGDLTPGLTTVRPPFFEVGVRATSIALGLQPLEDVLLPVEVVHRGSTAPPRGELR